MKDELCVKIIKTFIELRAKTYSYLTDDGNKDKKAKGTRKCVIKRKLKFENYKNCLESKQFDNVINHLEKKINIDSTKNVIKKFIRNNDLKMKVQCFY